MAERVILRDGQGIESVFGLEHGVPLQPQKFCGRLADRAARLPPEGGFPIRRGTALFCAARASPASVSPGDAGQIDLEHGADAGFAVGPDESFILLHNAVDRCEPQSGAFAQWLGGVERFEDVRQMFGENSGAIVANRDESIASRGNDRLLALNVVVIEELRRRFRSAGGRPEAWRLAHWPRGS